MSFLSLSAFDTTFAPARQSLASLWIPRYLTQTLMEHFEHSKDLFVLQIRTNVSLMIHVIMEHVQTWPMASSVIVSQAGRANYVMKVSLIYILILKESNVTNGNGRKMTNFHRSAVEYTFDMRPRISIRGWIRPLLGSLVGPSIRWSVHSNLLKMSKNDHN